MQVEVILNSRIQGADEIPIHYLIQKDKLIQQLSPEMSVKKIIYFIIVVYANHFSNKCHWRNFSRLSNLN